VVFPGPSSGATATARASVAPWLSPSPRVRNRGERRPRPAVQTDRGAVAADRVVIAAGAWSPTVARLAGVELPNVPYRMRFVSSEPLKPFLGPWCRCWAPVSTSRSRCAARSLAVHGGSRGASRPEPGLGRCGSCAYSRALSRTRPQVAAVKLLRQWAGCYDVTPDHSPVLGETPGVAGLLQMSGFVGHGFMMAPPSDGAWRSGWAAPRDEISATLRRSLTP